MKYLVIGGTGFIGSHLVEHLLNEGHHVRVNIRKTSSLKWLPKNNPNLEVVQCNVFNINEREDLLQNIDVVFHLAAVTKALDWDVYKRVNADLVPALYRAAKAVGTVKRFIYVSSQAARGPSPSRLGLTEEEYTSPISNYGKSKLLGECKLLRESGPLKVIVYSSSVFGPREKDIFEFIKQVSQGFCLFPGFSNKFVDMIYVHDFVKALIFLSAFDFHEDQKINVAGRSKYSYRYFADLVIKTLNKKFCLKFHIPGIFLQVIGTIFEVFYKLTRSPPLLNREKIREMTQDYWLMNCDKLYNQLNFKEEIGLETGMKETIDWYRNQGWIRGVKHD